MLNPKGPEVQLAESDAPVEGPVLVAFDFDGTLTTKDSYLAFLKWRTGPVGYAIGMVRLIPAGVKYLFNRDRGRLKAATTRLFLAGVSREDLESQAAAFATEISWSFFRPDALRTWRYWRGKGARVVIVTASPETTVAPFARALGAHRLIGTQLAFDGADKVTGGFASANCRGAEKVKRLREAFEDADQLAAAYGDTPGDKPMLSLAVEKGYKVFSGKPG